MERETINYRGKNYHRYPNAYREQHRKYFYRHDKWNESPVALHRQIYEDNYGPIPPGYHIHHDDDDFLNNAPKNLICLTPAEHFKRHPISQEERERRSEAGKKHNYLNIWQKKNPDLVKKYAYENGKNSQGVINWRKENPELAKRIYSEAGRKGAEARRKKRVSLQHNGS